MNERSIIITCIARFGHWSPHQKLLSMRLDSGDNIEGSQLAWEQREHCYATALRSFYSWCEF